MQGKHDTSVIARQELQGDKLLYAALFLGSSFLLGQALFTNSAWAVPAASLVISILATGYGLISSGSNTSRIAGGFSLAFVSSAWIAQIGVAATGVWALAVVALLAARGAKSSIGFAIGSMLLLPSLGFGLIPSSAEQLPSAMVLISLAISAFGVAAALYTQQQQASNQLHEAFSSGYEKGQMQAPPPLQNFDEVTEVRQALASAEQKNQQLQESFEQIEQTVCEYTSRVEHNVSRIDKAISGFKNINDLVAQSGEQAAQANEAVHIIASSNREVVDVVSSVDEIAFQTNLLALNASVEAARAGNSGAGFAVVATEVRNLALRSAESAKQIRRMMDDSTIKINEGLDRVRSSRKTAASIVEETKTVNETLEKISDRMHTQIQDMTETKGQIRENRSASLV